MRYFWLLIAGLVVVTGVLNVSRRTGEARAASAPPPGAQASASSIGRPSRAQNPGADREADPEPAVTDRDAGPDAGPDAGSARSEPAPQAARSDEPPLTATPNEPLAAAIEEAVPAPGPVSGPQADRSGEPGQSLDELLGVIGDAEEELPGDEVVSAAMTGTPADAPLDAPADTADGVVDTVPEQVLTDAERADPGSSGPDAGTVGPAYTVRGDGSVEVEGAGIIIGDGSPQSPFVLDWQVMRSVARDYNPKQGQEQLPDWVMRLDGKSVRVEGNTLLPVVASAVDEMLVMQNPWDGCCIGIPPTPYDAIEVKLAELTRMGNTVTGYGMVEGTFKVDPYIVQGWLLGLYLIEDASFESAAGMDLPGL